MGDEPLNKVFNFRLDKRDPNEAEVWHIIEYEAANGRQLRQLVVECILACQGMKPTKVPPSDKLLWQLRKEIQRFADLLDQAQTGGTPASYDRQDGIVTQEDNSKLSKQIIRNIANLISDATEYGEDE